MKPWIHAENSAKRWGGTPAQYLKIHDWFDQTKAHMPDMRHRAILHSSFGIYLCEQFFGTHIQIKILPKGGGVGFKTVQVRDIAEWHVIEDLGFIPTVQDYLKELPYYDWLGGKPRKAAKKMKLSDFDNITLTKPEIQLPDTFDTAPHPDTFKVVD